MGGTSATQKRTVAKASDGTLNDARYAQNKDVSRLASLASTSSAIDLPPTVLDLNYEKLMALTGLETFTRAGTDTYTDALGNAQTAGANVAAFDRQALGPTYKWLVPVGLKLTSGSGGQAVLNPTNLLLSDFTLIVDAFYDGNQTHNGSIVAINQGGAVTNRVEVGINSQQQAYGVVQAGGVVSANFIAGDIQSWASGDRRIVIGVKSNAITFSDGVSTYADTTGSGPANANLNNLAIGGGNFGGWVRRVRILGGAVTAAQATQLAAGPAPIATWGDSLTAGTGGTGPGTKWQAILAQARLPWSGVHNGGVGGQTTTQIRNRMVADVYRKDWTTVFWYGRNNITNPTIVMDDLAASIATLTHNRFVVMSVLNNNDNSENPGSQAYNQIIALNNMMAAKYPDNYLDIRSLLVKASGGANDHVNPSWAYDGIHLNNTGYAYIASTLDAYLRAKQWF